MYFNYHDIINTTVWLLAFPMAAVFLFICSFGDRKYKVHSFILFLYFLSGIVFPELDINSNNYKQDWVNQCYIILQITGVFSLLILLSSPFDKLNKYHFFILIFTVITHGMMVTQLEKTPLFLSTYTMFFYSYYHEIILIMYLLTLGVSYNGFNTAYNNAPGRIQRFIYVLDIRNRRRCKFISKRNRAKK